MRTLVREAVFKYNFSRLFNLDDEGLFDVLIKDFSQADKAFALELEKAVENGFDKYIEEIQKLSIGFKIDRIHATDKCALIIGMAELDNFPETPTIVIIDEAVNLTAKYSTEGSMNFVNGLLAEYSKGRKDANSNKR